MIPAWPEIPYLVCRLLLEKKKLWIQIAGKIRFALTPWVNHSWHTTFYVTPRGVTSSIIPYETRAFSLEFDFLDHVLRIETSDAQTKQIPLEPATVAQFHSTLLGTLAE